MPPASAPDDDRAPQRADARRNRERLIAAAVEAYGDDRADRTVVGIARSAGVGVGTLYRHFPTRDDLVMAAYGAELDRVCEAAPGLLADHPPAEAARMWMDAFVSYLTSKLGLADAVRAAVAAGAAHPRSQERLHDAMLLLFGAAARAGAMRPDLDLDDIALLLVGIAMVTGEPGMSTQRARMLDLLVDGLRPPPGPTDHRS